MQQFAFEVTTETEPGYIPSTQSITATVRIPVTNAKDMSAILAYLSSPMIKTDFSVGWLQKNHPGCSMEARGAPSPVYENGRGSAVKYYERVFRLSPPFGQA